MNGNAIIFSYDTRVNSIAFWSVIGIGAFALFMFVVIRYSKMDWFELLSFLLGEYVCILFLLTIFLRETPIYPDGFPKSFWGDKSELSIDIVKERLFNIVLFFPIGLLSCNLYKKHKLSYTIIFGLLFSISIEIIQYVLNKGVADIDDVICNGAGLMLGAVMGIFVYKMLTK